MAAKIQHTVVFPLKDDAPAEDIAKLQSIVEKFNQIPGIQASFRPEGGPGMTQAQLFEEVAKCKGAGKGEGEGKGEGKGKGKGKGKGPRQEGYNHCLMVIADDIPTLKTYLHGDAHKEWGPNVRPLFQEGRLPIVFDSDFKLSNVSGGGKIQHTVFYKLEDWDGERQAKMQEVCDGISKLEGVSASFAAGGCGGQSIDETCAALDWPNKTGGFTHVLTVVANDPGCLLSFFQSDGHKGMHDILKQGEEHPLICAMDSEWAITV